MEAMSEAMNRYRRESIVPDTCWDRSLTKNLLWKRVEDCGSSWKGVECFGSFF